MWGTTYYEQQGRRFGPLTEEGNGGFTVYINRFLNYLSKKIKAGGVYSFVAPSCIVRLLIVLYVESFALKNQAQLKFTICKFQTWENMDTDKNREKKLEKNMQGKRGNADSNAQEPPEP